MRQITSFKIMETRIFYWMPTARFLASIRFEISVVDEVRYLMIFERAANEHSGAFDGDGDCFSFSTVDWLEMIE